MVKPVFKDIKREILNTLDEANDEILVAVCWFTDVELFKKLLLKVQVGIKTALMVHNDIINNNEHGLKLQEFVNLGGRLYFSSSENMMHHKFCVIDRTLLITGSYNWTYNAETSNAENILILRNEAETVNAFHSEFLRMTRLLKRIEIVQSATASSNRVFDLSYTNEYLATDLISESYITRDQSKLKLGFEIALDKSKLRDKAIRLNLIKRKALKYSMGASIDHFDFVFIAKKGSLIPYTYEMSYKIPDDTNRVGMSYIWIGDDPAKDNLIKNIGIPILIIPKKSTGLIKFNLTIDFEGYLKISVSTLEKIIFESCEDFNEFLENV